MSSIGSEESESITNTQSKSLIPFIYNNQYAHRPNEYRPMSLTPAQNLLADHKILVVDTYEECKRALNELKSKCKEYDVLGIDTESKTSFFRGKGRNQSVLLQLASQHGLCILIRLSYLNRIPGELEELLANPKILKVGVESKSDGDLLYKDYRMRLSSAFDLRYMAAFCGLKPGGLAVMAKEHLLYDLPKSRKTQCSNWELPKLSEKQIQYAALDAIIGYKLFLYYSSFPSPIYHGYFLADFFDINFSHPNAMMIYEKCLNEKKTENNTNN